MKLYGFIFPKIYEIFLHFWLINSIKAKEIYYEF